VLNDPISQITALKAGEVDMLNSMSPDLYGGCGRIKTLRAGRPADDPHGAMLNLTRPPFDDLRVAKAIGCYGTTPSGDRREGQLGLANHCVDWSRWTSRLCGPECYVPTTRKGPRPPERSGL